MRIHTRLIGNTLVGNTLAIIGCCSLLLSIQTATAQIKQTAAQPTSTHSSTDAKHTHFKREDVFGLEYANQPQWSPDGEQIVYQRHFMDKQADQLRANLWLIEPKTGAHQALTTGARTDTGARWSPQGDRIAYIGRDSQQRPQIMLRWLDSGREAQLTQAEYAPNGISWSPDGRWIVFSQFVASESQPLVKALKPPQGAEWAAAPTVIDRPVFRQDGRGITPQGHRHLFIVPAEGGTPRQLTQGDFPHNSDVSWSQDGTVIYFSARRHQDWEYEPQNSEIYQLRLADLQIEAVTDRYGPDRSPSLSPDGHYLAWLGYDDQHLGYTNTELYIRDLKSGQTRSLSKDLDRNIDDFHWDRKGQKLYIKYDDQGQGILASLNLKGKHEVLASDVGGTGLGRPYGSGNFDVNSQNELIYTATSADRPADLVLLTKAQKQHRLTTLNEDLLAHKTLARVESIRYPSSHDQQEIQAWLAYPPDYEAGKTYPLILEIHGGPFANYGSRFSAEVQLYTAAGYIVLYVNPRGSTSYGAEFANLIHHNYPGEDYDDLVSGVDEVIKRGLTTEDQLYVTGGSGGGVLTAWIVGKTNRFKAAVVAKPVINWTSFVLNADLTTFFHRYWFESPPWENQAEYWRRSPLSLVGNVSTPTMVLSGEADYRTPISEAEQYYQALKLRRIDSVLVRVPGAPHFIAGRPSQLIAKNDYILAWFERYGPQAESSD